MSESSGRSLAPAHKPGPLQICGRTKRCLARYAGQFWLFEYEPPKNLHDPYKAVKGLLAHAHEVVDKVHGVIFPELALTPNELAKIRSYLVKKDIFLISGVREAPSSPRQGGRNYLSFDFPFLSKYFLHFEQTKHHRWRLDKRQIIQYGLGSALGVADSTGKGESRYWWEHIKIESRNLYFIALEDWCKRVE